MSTETVKGEEIPLLPEEDTQGIGRAPDQVGLERNCQLIDNFIQKKWPDKAEVR